MQTVNDELKAKLKDNASPEELKKAVENVRQALYKVSSAAYQSTGGQQQGNPNADFSKQEEPPKQNDDGTIDAEYTEVKDDKK